MIIDGYKGGKLMILVVRAIKVFRLGKIYIKARPFLKYNHKRESISDLFANFSPFVLG